MADTLLNISADSVDDFMDKVPAKVGEGDGVMGLTTYKTSEKHTLDDDGNIATVTFDVTTTTKRAHWSGGKADANNKKAIQTAEELNKKHEEKHRKLASDICAREFPKAVKALKGKSEADVKKALDAINKLIDDAYEDLDKKEGATEITKKSDGTFTVKQVGA